MGNGIAKAEHWTQFLASRPYIKAGAQILENYQAGRITRFCDCGCNSYEMEVSDAGGARPLVSPGERAGCVLSLAFRIEGDAEGLQTLEINMHADARGYFSGLDVDFCANSWAVPDGIVVVEPPFHVTGTLAS